MKNKWMRQALAWLLAVVLTCAMPAMAEGLESEAQSAAVEAFVGELDAFDLSGDAGDGAASGEAPEIPAEPDQPAETAEPAEAESPVVTGEPADDEGPAEAETPGAAEPTEAPGDIDAQEGVVEPEATVDPEATVEPDPEALLAAGGLELNASNLTLGVKETFVLRSAVSGAQFATSNAKIATVDAQSGKITAKKVGKATITATLGDRTATCEVTVLKAPGKVTLNTTKLALGAGETYALAATIPANTASGITWTSSNSSVATVDAAGLVTARGAGSAKITARACNGKKAVCALTVTAAPTGIAFGYASLSLSVGQSRAPEVRVTGGEKRFTLESANASVVRAEGDRLIAVAQGSATVVARTYNGLTASLTVTVVAAPGSVSLGFESVDMGVKETLQLRPVLDVNAPADVTYSTSSAKIATVSETGLVTAKKAGSATVTVVTHNGLRTTCVVNVRKAPRKLSLNPDSLELGAGESRRLSVTLPAGTASSIEWKSSNEAVISVSADGTVTAKAAGSATVTATTFNGKKATCAVTVKSAPKGVSLSPASVTLGVGQRVSLNVSLSGGAGAVTFTSANTAVAAISEGEIVARGAGTTDVTARTYNGLTATARVTVVPAPTRLTLEKTSVTLYVGEQYRVQPTVNSGTQAGFTYSSGKAKIAEVSDEGVITAKKTGSAVITVKTHNGLSATLNVSVIKPPTKVVLKPSKLTLQEGESGKLTATTPGATGAEVTFTSSNPAVASVSEDGTVVAGKIGTARITAATFNGKTAECVVTVTELRSPPATPKSVKLTAPNASTLTVSWERADYATGYRVYFGTGSDPADATLYGSYGADTTQARLRGLTGGQTYYVFVTACNKIGETALSGARASAKVPVDLDGLRVNLNYTGKIMLARGATRQLTATPSASGYAGGVTWETTNAAVASVSGSGRNGVITGTGVGSAIVSAELDNGMSAAVTVVVVDTSDLSDANFQAVQKLIANQENLLNEDQGGDVIWQMISAKLVSQNLLVERVQTVVEKLKNAETLFKAIYVYAFGTYDIVGEAEKNKKGAAVDMSHFLTSDNTLYLAKSYNTNDTYAYVMIHESGHAVDYNAEGNKSLTSRNNDAIQAILSDVRNLLTERVGSAVTEADVSPSSVNTTKVVDAVMNYRELLHHDQVMATMNANEQKVYEKLITIMRNEMNATFPTNNGTMVWDAIEGATNYAVHGTFGHYYMFSREQYRELANYYYYDRQGNPLFTTEPWAEFYSASVMKDEETESINWKYLPQTCKYFLEELAPKIMNYFKNLVKAR